jgi:acetylornithine deacetylase/succinyl-diaminopimelate desuccinylase-like protein
MVVWHTRSYGEEGPKQNLESNEEEIMGTTKSDLEKRVVDEVEKLESELVRVALDLGDMDTSQPHEKIASDYVFEWFRDNGFSPKKLGSQERFNVLGKYTGTGKGRSLLFCSHLDNERRENVEQRLKDWDKPIYTKAWREGDTLVGHGIANDRGPMACWMIAAKALKGSNIKLQGDILLSAVVGETGGSPVDEFESPTYDSHELGARYVATHGGLADFAMIAEATANTIVPVECGFAYFKITIYSGPASYTPFFPYPEPSMEKSVNSIVRMAKFIERFQQYAYEYQKKHTYSFDGGEVVPKTIIGAIRGGLPHIPHITPEVCSIYVDYRTPPGKNPLELKRELEGLLDEMGMDGTVEMYKYLPGFEAWKVEGYETLKTALVESHVKVFKDPPPKKAVTYTLSMWRDINPYNELGVPSICYGFPTGYSAEGAKYDIDLFRVKIEDMISAAKVYALLALDICSRQV